MQDLITLTAAALRRHGAVVERTDLDSILVALPPETAEALELPDWVALTRLPAAAPAGHTLVAPESPLLEKLQGMVEARGHYASIHLACPPPKKLDAARVLDENFSVLNGAYRLLSSEVATTTYYLFHFRYEAVSDDRVEGILDACVRADGLSTPLGMGDRLRQRELVVREAPPPGEPSGPELQRCYQTACGLVTWRVRELLVEFERNLRQRMQRDARRVQSYFTELEQQIRKRKLRRKGKGDEKVGSESRLKALSTEYRRQIRELTDRTQVQVKLGVFAAVCIQMPAYHLEIEVRRRRQSFRKTLTWNPADRALEASVCVGCGRSTPAIAICDERLHCLCAVCHGPCAECARPYCRKCHPGGCPRRHD